MIHVTNTIDLNDREIHERFVRAFGARGQNANKEATAVELRFDIGRSSLPPDVKDQLTVLGGRHVTNEGVLVVVSGADRSQAENRVSAHTRFLALVQRAAKTPRKRKATRPGLEAREERLASKTRQSAVKRSRSGRDDEKVVS